MASSATAPAREYTMKEVQASVSSDSKQQLIVVDGLVYDVKKFLAIHPGGPRVLEEWIGKDATEAFFDMHRTEVLHRYKKLCVGRLAGVPSDHVRAIDRHQPGSISAIPYTESSFWNGWRSPYYTEKHIRYRAAVREFYDRVIAPKAPKMDAAGKEPTKDTFLKMGAAGILAARLPPSATLRKMVKKLNIPCPGGIAWDDFDCFCEQITHEEHARLGTPGYCDGLGIGFEISAPAMLAYASPSLQDAVMPSVLRGEKRMVLAITEPTHGSDVAGLRTYGTKSECGQYYYVTGQKKWITGGLNADYFVTAVRTGGSDKPGMAGISLMLIQRSEGLSTKSIKTAYDTSAGTAYVLLDRVKVPVSNILGEEHKGFRCIMSNFNHERWMMSVSAITMARVAIKECFLWAQQRKVFGKPLISQPVIMAKLADCIEQVESVHALTELITYQMQQLPHKEQGRALAGPIAMLKVRATRVAMVVANHAMQIFGGRSITRSGPGRVVEAFFRSVKYNAIYGGSEEILDTLLIKQAMKRVPLNSRL